MTYETKPGQGALFINDKGDNEKRPDRRGDLVCPCCSEPLKLAGWIKQGKTGPWLSIKADKKDDAPKPAGKQPEDFDDSIPF
jgi:hypothetical protein